MRTQIIVATAVLSLMAATQAEAAPIYTTTDLGAGSQLQAGAAGQVYGVAGADGAVYAFDKSPVTSIYERTDTPLHHLDSYYVYTMQNGAHKIGYIQDRYAGLGNILIPTFANNTSYNNAWYTTINSGLLPISDINSHGQFVGQSTYYAAFSDVNGLSHPTDASLGDNLNNYIVTIPGVTLTSAVKIDDLGRIIAIGSNGDDYLLTPTALGSASPVPEPSSAMMLSLVGSLLGLRSIRRRWRS